MDKRKNQQTPKMDELLTEDAIMISTAHDDVELGAALPTNLYFTICDDMSNDSADFLAINASSLPNTQIKQEPKFETNQMPIQYRIVRSAVMNSSTATSPTSLTLRAVSVDNSNARSLSIDASNMLPTGTSAMQLPSGCEIYLVKEYIDSDCSDMLIAEECEEMSSTTTSTTASINQLIPTEGAAINHSGLPPATKLTSVTHLPKAIKTEPGTHNQLINVISPEFQKTTIATPKTTAGSAGSNYKKRDEKRRRTHNEVERRRRDKINSWIFKLKEMLPTESGVVRGTKHKINNKNAVCNGNPISLPLGSATNTKTSSVAQFDIIEQVQQQRNNNNSSNVNSRSPPNDSKSQILIKACEYIKQMQDEITSLRECLNENEKLRSNNQRLQFELNRLKVLERRRLLHEQQQCNNIEDTNIIDSSDDFTLALCTNGNDNLNDVTSSTLFGSSPIRSPSSISLISGDGNRKAAVSVPYTKRELIISDYVD